MAVSNTTPHPAKIYSHEGIAQLLFYEGEEVPEVTYKDRKGKYQAQQGIVLPKVVR
jgi:dCTP deaminase